MSQLGPFEERLGTLLSDNETRHIGDQLRMTRIHDLLCREGFDKSYDAVRRYARLWKEGRRKDAGYGAHGFIPLMFEPGEADQFDWSHEDVEIAGEPMRVKVALMRVEAECLRWAATHAHLQQKELTGAEALELERLALQPMLAPFDGFHETAHVLTSTCLISFDRNRSSVIAWAARRRSQAQPSADRGLRALRQSARPRCRGMR